MKKKNLYISNLAWKNKSFISIKKLIKINKFKGIDLAPIRINNSWLNIDKESKKFSLILTKEKIKVNAIQGIYYKKNFNLFNKDKNNINKIFNHTIKIIKISKIYKCKKIIIGSSEFRKKGELGTKDADQIFINYFKKFINILNKERIYFCIETIPKQYGEDYLFNFNHTINLIKKINCKWIRVNFDSSLFHFKKFDKNILKKNLKYIKNVQVTERNFNFLLKPKKENILFCKQLMGLKNFNDISLEIISDKTDLKKLNYSMKNFNKLLIC